jgi:D-amino peptidase
MNKIYLSADIEGTARVAHWDETEIGKPGFEQFARRMTREVAAACEGAMAAGVREILVKDAHDSGRNIDPEELPDCVRIFRGWGSDPYCMMSGLDESFDGVLFTGYHSAAGAGDNPLSHTMDTGVLALTINGEPASELLINSLTAARLGVPVLFVSGDEGLCHWMDKRCPGVVAVPVSRGVGRGSISLPPRLACKRIREGVREALERDPAGRLFPLPDAFEVEVSFRNHDMARRAGFYPGARQNGPRSVRYQSGEYLDVITFFHFVL